MAVDTRGHLLALHVTAASADDRAEVSRIARDVQSATGQSVDVAFVDQGYTGGRAAAAAAEHGIALEVIVGSETGLRSAPKTMGRRAILRMGHALPKARQGL